MQKIGGCILNIGLILFLPTSPPLIFMNRYEYNIFYFFLSLDLLVQKRILPFTPNKKILSSNSLFDVNNVNIL